MSRTGLHRPRRTRPASQRPALDTRLLLTLFPPHILHPNTHNKRCPKAKRLDLRSDLSPSRPTNGRSPDKSRQALREGNCQVSAPLIGRNGFAPSGDAQEHGVKMLHWATAPLSDSTVVTIGKLRSMNAGHESTLPSLRVVEHFRWARLPQSENFSRLVHTLSEVWGKDSTVVTTGEFPTTNAGHGSPLPSPRVVEHFRWARLPQSENFSRLVHVLSGVWGCRRVDAGVDRPRGRTPRIGTGVADFLHKPSGTFHPHPSLSAIPALTIVIPAEAGRRCAYGVNPSLRNNHPQPCNSPHPLLLPRRGRPRACPPGVGWWGIPRTANRPRMPSNTTPFTLSFRCPARNLGWGVLFSSVSNWRQAPTPREIPRKSLQASFNQNSYEFNQCSINPPPDYNVSASKPPTPP